MPRKKPLPLLENIEITDIAAEGQSIARVDGKVLFVPQVIPGDIVDVQVRKKRTSYMEGFVVALKKPSPMRIDPFCEHFGVCGGCKWQHLPYPEQLKYKQKQVTDAFERIGKVSSFVINPILPSENTRDYRNKLEYTFSENRWLSKEEIIGETYVREPGVGFHIPGMFDKVLDIHQCHLQPEPSNAIRLAIKEYALQKGLSFFNLRTHEGFMRNCIIRNTSSGEWMVILALSSENEEEINALLNHISSLFPQITSLMYVINPKHNDTINDLDIRLFKGRDHIIEQMEGLKFRIGPKSFYQTNSQQAYRLYCVAREMAAIKPGDVVYDLYTGTGTIACFVSSLAKKVIGIEFVPEAIDDANLNANMNAITNTTFYAGDIKNVLNQQFIDDNGHPHVVILDPPRAGIHPSVAEVLLAALPERIVYVSCNPATQARDVALLSQSYAVKAIQPVDMFPHTHHVENVALLVRN